MTAETESLILAILKRIQADIAEIKQEQSDMKLRINVLEDQMASVVLALSGINHRIDRLQSDVSVIKRRLNLVDAD